MRWCLLAGVYTAWSSACLLPCAAAQQHNSTQHNPVSTCTLLHVITGWMRSNAQISSRCACADVAVLALCASWCRSDCAPWQEDGPRRCHHLWWQGQGNRQDRSTAGCRRVHQPVACSDGSAHEEGDAGEGPGVSCCMGLAFLGWHCLSGQVAAGLPGTVPAAVAWHRAGVLALRKLVTEPVVLQVW